MIKYLLFVTFDEENTEFGDVQMRDIRNPVYALVRRAILNSYFEAAFIRIVRNLPISGRRRPRGIELRITRFLQH